jgi:prophage antirepressor-like protein
MIQSLKILDFKSSPVRLLTDVSGTHWWLAKEVCDILGISKYRDILLKLDADERASFKVDTPGGSQDMSFINEPGLYRLIMRSRNPSAIAFQRWVTHDVLPSIRASGSYGTDSALKETLRILSAVVNRMESVDKRLDKLESNPAQSHLPQVAVKEVSLRLKISQIIRAFVARQSNGYSHQDAFDKLYYQFKYRYNVDLPHRARNAGYTSILEYAESHAFITDLYNLTLVVFEGVN